MEPSTPGQPKDMQLTDVSVKMRRSLLELFEGNESDATHWLNQSCCALGQRTPADFIKESHEGETAVLNVIYRLEHGIHQ
ncbi:MAG: DUF2384 domain-containing protein [Idiomarina sp.]|nr:DUF2384 domain-containing protein [Idiomarina sp.]